MESLNKIMQIIDANNKHIPEGDYIDICFAMKDVHVNLKKTDVYTHTYEYLDYERELTKMTIQIENLHKKYNEIHSQSKMTRAMRREAIREFLFEEGFHEPVEYTEKTLTELGFKNINYDKYMERYNLDVFLMKKEILLEIQNKRELRNVLIKDMANLS